MNGPDDKMDYPVDDLMYWASGSGHRLLEFKRILDEDPCPQIKKCFETERKLFSQYRTIIKCRAREIAKFLRSQHMGVSTKMVREDHVLIAMIYQRARDHRVVDGPPIDPADWWKE